MGLVFRTRLFADSYTKDEKNLIRKTTLGGAIGHGAVGAGAGYLGGRLVGKLATPNKEAFIEKYLKSHPDANKIEAEAAYKARRGKFNKYGALAGGVLGTVGGAFGGNSIGKGIVGANRYAKQTMEEMRKTGKEA